MKTIRILLPMALCFGLALPFATAQTEEVTETGLPGDNFSLEAALELFKKSNSLEEFEQLLNSEEEGVNNLDLNEDGEIDYIRVEDNVEGDVHAVVLQIAVSEEESQDIAVIEIEKTGEETAMLQILGDEEIYGETTIVEPFDAAGEAEGKGGPSADYAFHYIVVNVYPWPCVRFVYAPAYRPWRSPYRWGYYPTWWRPWRPHPFRTYHTRMVVYQPRYHVVHTHRVVHAHRVYTPHRRTSAVVHTRTTRVVAKPGRTKVTTTKAGVKKTPNGVVAGKKTTTVTPRGKTTKTTKAGVRKTPNGKVAGKKKTVVRKKKN